METVRAFVGIPLPEPCQEIVAALTQRLAALSRASLSRTRRGNAHITLKFLGDVPARGPHGIEAVVQALSGVIFAPFALRFAGGGFFPGPARPRVVWAGMAEGAGPCRELAAGVERALAPLGFAPEARPFAAHLTLARVRDAGIGGDWPAVQRLLDAAAWPTVAVTAFTLFRSELGPDGPRYASLGDFAARAS